MTVESTTNIDSSKSQEMDTPPSNTPTTAPPTKEVDAIVPESSQQDDREYKFITLPNKLKALLISDPTTDKASAAMDVGVGHLCDPDDAPGLAHFLEHLLFMGTEKYPNENEYNVYLSSNGGSSNAYTDMESTNYYFDVSADKFEGAMDRFAQFFISPLFQEDTTDRELQAVDSEHAKNLQNDSWREFQLSKSLARGDHPFSKFGSGNLVTLKEEPEKKGLDIRKMLLDFHATYYSANIMKLVILGKESMSDLEQLVHKYFANVPNQDIEKPSFPGEPYGPEQLGKRVSIVPVKDGVRCLKMNFPTREVDSLYREKPAHYISHLIGHEGMGSILELLKNKGWANELSAGVSRNCSDWGCFTITIDLTDVGLENIDNIIEIVFAYLSLLKSKGVQRWIHDETATVSACAFRFLSKRNPIDYTCSLASTMQLYPPEHILSGPYMIYEYDPDLINKFLEYFTPENMVLYITSKKFEGTTESKERWYETEYTLEDLSKDLCDKWSKASIDSSLVENKLHLPEQNDMIATDFAICKYDDMPKDEPRLILDTDLCRLWYKPDNVFDMPKVNIMALLRTKVASTMSVVESVMAALWTQIFNEHATDFTYLASMASLHSSVSNVQRGIDITVSGYNDKAHILLRRIIKTMTEVPEKLELSLFDRVKDKISKQYQNFMFAQPYQHAFYAGDLCLETSKWSIEDKIMVLESVEMSDIISFSRQLLSRFHLEILVHGNMSCEATKEIANIILEGLNPSVPPQSIIPTLRVVQLEEGKEYVHRMPEPNVNNTNSCVELLLQVGSLELADVSVLALIHQLLKEPAFNELRTNEQLGYIVHTTIKTNGDNIKGLLFLIQSDSFDPLHVDERIEAFIERLRTKIMTMGDEEFQSNITALSQSCLEKNKNIGEESNKYWNAICNNHYLFKRLNLIAAHLETTSKSQVLRFFDKYIAKGSPHRRKLSVQVFAKPHMEKYESPVPDGVSLFYSDKVDGFKQSMPLFPLSEKVDLGSFKVSQNEDS